MSTGVVFAALSADDQVNALTTVRRHGLTYPVGYDTDPRTTAEVLRSYPSPSEDYLESGSFVLNSAGEIAVAVYSSFAIGRLLPDDVLGLVRKMIAHDQSET